MDRLDAMQVLLAVVDNGSLSAAGRKLNMSLPSVSRKVAELEGRIGARLLIRTARNIQLTDAGHNYVKVIRPLVSQLEDAERRASAEYDQPCGELNIALPGGASRLLAVPAILEFLEANPEISVHMIADERRVDLVEARVDVAVRLGELPDSSLYAVNVGQAVVSTVAAPEYLRRKGRPAHPSELSEHDAIMFEPLISGAWTYSVDGETFQSTPHCRVRANRTSICIEAAVRGYGLTRVARIAAEHELRAGTLTTVLDEFECASYPVHLIYVKQGALPLKVRAFIDWMAPRLRDKLKDLNALTGVNTGLQCPTMSNK
jgi:DNA-binding transcriptional LysR family regulator